MKKIKNKKLVILIVVLALLLCATGVGVWLAIQSNQTVEQTESDTYTVYVVDSSGASVEGAFVTLYTKENKAVNWLPYVSSMSGRVQFDEGIEEGCYVKVEDVPSGYEVDLSQKYTFDEDGKVTIVLNSDSTIYVAQVGTIKYKSFTDAITMANASGQDVVIELLADVTLKTCTINNTYGKNVTINGNGYTITTENENNAFCVRQETGFVAFNNMNIKHNNTGCVVICYTPITMNMTDVNIEATGGNYCLLNPFSKGDTTTFNLTRVDVKMTVESKGKDSCPAVIRTGNAGDTKSVNLNLVDCNFDTTGATGRSGIIVMRSTTADIKLKNTTIQTLDAAPIRGIEQSISQTMVVDNCKFGSKAEEHQKTPITGYDAQIGNVAYMILTDAIDVAEKTKGDVTIKLLNDLNQRVGLKPEAGRTLTIDGNGRKINVRESRSGFVLEKATVPGGTVEFKNMTVGHSSSGYVIYTRQPATINMSDVYINAITCNRSLIYVSCKDKSTTNLNLNRVTLTMDLGDFSDTDTVHQAIIRSGNTGEEKTFNVNMTDCNFDLTKASGVSGIAIMKGTKSTVNLVNTTIHTKDIFAVRSQKQDINLSNTTLTSNAKKHQEYPIEGYETKIGDTFYSIEQAVTAANNAKTDTTIKFITDFTIKAFSVYNKNGKQVVFDGNGKTLTTSGGNAAFTGGGKMLFKNMTINHENTGCVVQLTKNGTLDMTDVDIQATEGKSYDYCLLDFLANGEGNAMNLTRVNISMEVAGKGATDATIIRTGKSDDAKTVSINLIDCNLDATKATGRHAIVVKSKTNADIQMTNTTINTLDGYAIKSNESSISQTVQMTNCTFDSKTENFKENPFKGYEAKIGDVVYLNLEDALKVAYAANGDTSIQLLDNLNKRFVIQPIAGKTITIDGNGKKMTLNKDVSGFVVQEAKNPGGTIELKNMTIEHNSTGYVLYSRQAATINLKDITVDATVCKDALIKVQGSETEVIDVDFSLTGVKMTVDLAEDLTSIPEAMGVIVTRDDGQNKNVNITLVDSKIDTRKASGVNGIVIGKGTNAVLNLENTQIKTVDANAIKSIEQTKGQATVTDSCKISSVNADTMKGYTMLVGNTWYVNYADAMDAIKDASGAVSITLTADGEMDLTNLTNVTIDTNGFCLATTGSKADSVTIVSETQMTTGGKILYLSLQSALEKANSASEDVTITVLDNSQIHLTGISNENGKNITIDSNGHSITATGTIRNGVTILSEARYADKDKAIYTNFADAMSKANEASQDVTVTLYTDISGQVNINPKKDKKLTIDGNGHIYTIQGSAWGFVIKDGSAGGTVELKNIIMNHSSSNRPVVIRQQMAFIMTDVNINATKCNDHLISVEQYSPNYKFTLDFTRVNVSVNLGEDYKETDMATNRGIIVCNKRTQSGTEIKLNLTDCNLNTSKASGRGGIAILDNTTVDLTMSNTVITTKDACPVYDTSGNTSVKKNGCTITATDYKAQFGNTLYTSVGTAVSTARNSDLSNVNNITVELLNDIAGAINVKTIRNKTFTIDGNGHVYTVTSTSSPAFDLIADGDENGTVVFKNMTIEQRGSKNTIMVRPKGTTVNVSDVTVNATNFDNAIIFVQAKDSSTTTLNLTRMNVNMTWDDSKYSSTDTKAYAVIRTASGTGDVNNVNINLDGCNFDTTGANGVSGIVIMPKTVANVKIKDSTIKTKGIIGKGGTAIYGYNNPATTNPIAISGNSLLESGGSAAQADTIKNYGNVTGYPDASAQAATLSVENEEPTTKRIILDVPVKLFDAFIEWIREFASKNDWNLEL